MAERYDPVSAQHYAAYRPPLHAEILKRLIRAGERFTTGLDVGCGTGYSTVALAEYCDRVIGIDPSEAMLAGTIPHPRITYRLSPPGTLLTADQSPVDVITFAGSLMYARSERLRTTLNQACHARPSTVILIYDFEILLYPVLQTLGFDPPSAAAGYDYRIDLSDWPEFRPEIRRTERVGFQVTTGQLAHLLLSDSHRHDLLVSRGPVVAGSVFEMLKRALGGDEGARFLEADLYLGRWHPS